MFLFADLKMKKELLFVIRYTKSLQTAEGAVAILLLCIIIKWPNRAINLKNGIWLRSPRSKKSRVRFPGYGNPGRSGVELACSSCVSVGFVRVLRLPRDSPKT